MHSPKEQDCSPMGLVVVCQTTEWAPSSGANSSLHEYAPLLPKSMWAVCLHCKAEHLTKKQRYISAEKSFSCSLRVLLGGGGLFVFVCFFWGGREGLVDFFLISLQSCRILRKEVLDEIPVPLKSLGKFLLTSPGSASIYSMVPCVFFLGDTQIICALLTNQTFLFLF